MHLLMATILCIAICQPKLISVQEIFRHGSRYPFLPKEKDGTKELLTPPSLAGKLTEKGAEEHYELGKSIYQKYENLLQSAECKTHPKLCIEVRSTNYDRTIESAEAHVSGFL